LDRTVVYYEQAAYCAYLLRRAVDPRRRALIERERQDWLMLAYQTGLWTEVDGPGAAGDAQRSFAPSASRSSLSANDR
jgi:hypothetical protein